MEPRAENRIQNIFNIILSVLLSLIFSALFCKFYLSKNSTSTESVSNNITINTQETSKNEFSVTSKETVIANIKDSVVEINCTTTSGTSAGSGVIVGEDTTKGISYIITNHHVIESASQIKIIFTNKDIAVATLVGSDPDNDIAVLKVYKSNLKLATFGNSDNIVLGEDVIVIGNPLGALGGTVSTGIVSCTSREIAISGQTMTLIQTNAAINSGNSGGAMFNSNGQLIGIVNAKASALGVEGLGFAIPSNTAKNVMVSLLQTATDTTYGYIEGKTKLGVTFKTTAYGNLFNYVPVIVVSSVDKGGSCEKAGIKEGDILVSIKIGENTIVANNNLNDISAFIKNANLKIDDKIIITIKKTVEGANQDIEVTMLQYVYNPGV